MSDDRPPARHWSFVVPAWNEADLLPATLDALHDAATTAGLSYEVVVADDGSTDATAALAREHGARVVACQARQIAATRNAGARAATGDVLVFVDADTRVTQAVVRSTLAAVDEGAVYGGADVTWDGTIPRWSRVFLRATLAMYRWRGLASGAYLFCTRAAYDAAGGFDESLYAAEEYDFSTRLRKQGGHAWVRDRVVTSGRKLRSHSARELLGQIFGMVLRGRRGLADRKRLDLWYAERRPDPGAGDH